MIKKIVLLLFSSVFFLLTLSCHEEETPERIVYGDPSAPLVFNLRVIDLGIDQKRVTLAGNDSGDVFLDPSGVYLIYSPFPNFTEDEVVVQIGQSPLVKVHFISTTIDSSCKTYAPAFTIVVPKNSGVHNQAISIDLCTTGLSGKKYALSSGQEIIPVNGVEIYGFGSSIGIRYTPEKDFTGIGELLYDVGYYRGETDPSMTKYDPGKYDVFVSGYVKIVVTE